MHALTNDTFHSSGSLASKKACQAQRSLNMNTHRVEKVEQPDWCLPSKCELSPLRFCGHYCRLRILRISWCFSFHCPVNRVQQILKDLKERQCQTKAYKSWMNVSIHDFAVHSWKLRTKGTYISDRKKTHPRRLAFHTDPVIDLPTRRTKETMVRPWGTSDSRSRVFCLFP